MDAPDPVLAIEYFAAQVAAYLVGALPFGLLIARRFGKIDIRDHGSGNIGATNVGRVLGFRFFVVVFILDFLKGALPVALALWMRSQQSAEESAFLVLPETVGLAAILGHMFPVYLNFKGGKGVATSLGVIEFLAPIPALFALGTWLLAMWIWRIVSLASMIAAVAFVAGHFATCPAPWTLRYAALTAFVFLTALLIVFRHRSNIVRLFKGTEPRIQFGKKTADTSK